MAVSTIAPTLALAPDWGAVMPIEGSASPAHEVTFTSEVVANALETAAGTGPTGNLPTLQPICWGRKKAPPAPRGKAGPTMRAAPGGSGARGTGSGSPRSGPPRVL